MTFLTIPPQISMHFDAVLLSKPIFRYNAENLLKIATFLKKKMESYDFKKFPGKLKRLNHQYNQFMELYEWATIKEKENEKQAFIKANSPFYRPRLANRNNQRLFERLDDRRKESQCKFR